ncbi:MAG: hypothetical protein P8X57_01365 [Cyclobacteriaceae bacterium]
MLPIIRKLYIVLLILAGTSALGQDMMGDTLQQTLQLPEDLRSGKAIMIIEPLPDPDDSRLRGEWLPIAEKAQPFMKLAGIDVVAAYHEGDIRSGTETEKAFLNMFDERNITHLVIIKQQTSGYEVSVTKFDRYGRTVLPILQPS